MYPKDINKYNKRNKVIGTTMLEYLHSSILAVKMFQRRIFPSLQDLKKAGPFQKQPSNIKMEQGRFASPSL
jgi:hypothetical protein